MAGLATKIGTEAVKEAGTQMLKEGVNELKDEAKDMVKITVQEKIMDVVHDEKGDKHFEKVDKPDEDKKEGDKPDAADTKDTKQTPEAETQKGKIKPSDTGGKNVASTLNETFGTANNAGIGHSSSDSYIPTAAEDSSNDASFTDMADTVLGTVTFFAYTGTYAAFIIIFLLCIANLIIFFIVIIYYFLIKNDSNAIFKDTLKYKFLDYVDFTLIHTNGNVFSSLSEQAGKQLAKFNSSSEPFFYLFLINFIITIIVLLYICLGLLYGLIFLALLFVMILKIWQRNSFDAGKLKDESGTNIFLKHIVAPVWMGLLCAGIIFGLHHLIFKNYIFPQLRDVRLKIVELDKVVLDTISINQIDVNLVNILIKEGNDKNGRNQQLNAYFCKKLGIPIPNNTFSKFSAIASSVSTIQTKDSTTMSNIVAELTFATLYVYIYDNLPIKSDSNKDAVNAFFFKVPDNVKNRGTTSSLDVNKSSTTTSNTQPDVSYSNISFIALMPEKTGITRVNKIYRTEQFVLKNSTEEIIQIMLLQVDQRIDSVNAALLKFPAFKNMVVAIGAYIFIMFFFAVILLMIYSLVIMKHTAKEQDKSGIGALATAIVGVETLFIPYISKVVLSAAHPDEYAACAEHNSDDNTFTKCVVSPGGTMDGNTDNNVNAQ
jgi:hypothetical protein